MSFDLGNVTYKFPIGGTIIDKNFVNLDSSGAIWNRPKFDTIYPLVTSASGLSSMTYTEPDHIIKAIDNSRIVLVYMTLVSTTYYVNVRVGSINNVGVITWGSVYQPYSTTNNISKLQEVIIVDKSTVAKILVRCVSISGAGYCNCQVIEITGTTVSNSGSMTSLAFPATNSVGTAITSGYVLISNGTTNITAYQLNISGYAVTMPVASITVIAGKTSNYKNSIVRIDNFRALLVYNWTSGTTNFDSVVLKTNYTTLTAGTIRNIDIASSGSDMNCCILTAQTDGTATAVAFYGNPICQRVLDINDTVINGYSIVNFASDVCYRMQSVGVNNNTCILGTNETIYTFQFQGANLVLLDTISKPTGFSMANGTCVFPLGTGRYLYVDGTGIAKVIQKSKLIGVAQGSSGTVILKGIVQGLSGITAGGLMYTDGFQFQADNTSSTFTKVGTGLSTTDLMMNDIISAVNTNL